MKNSGLVILELEITTRCNLDCKHCYVDRNNPVDIPREKVISLIKQAARLGTYRLVFTGGEPMLSPHLIEYATLAKKLKIPQVMLMTNGTLITKSNAIALKIFDLIQLSIDVPPGTQPHFRIDYFEQLKKTIDLLSKNKIKVTLQATLHKSLLPVLENIGELAKTMNIKIGINRLSAVGSAASLQNEILSPRELKEALTKISKMRGLTNLIGCSDPLLFLADEKRMNLFKNQEQSSIMGGCIAGVSTLYVTAQQEVYICPFVREKIASTKKQTLTHIWTKNKTLAKLRKREFDGPCGECEYTPYCGGCRASSLKTYGTLFGSDALCFKNLQN